MNCDLLTYLHSCCLLDSLFWVLQRLLHAGKHLNLLLSFDHSSSSACLIYELWSHHLFTVLLFALITHLATLEPLQTTKHLNLLLLSEHTSPSACLLFELCSLHLFATLLFAVFTHLSTSVLGSRSVRPLTNARSFMHIDTIALSWLFNSCKLSSGCVVKKGTCTLMLPYNLLEHFYTTVFLLALRSLLCFLLSSGLTFFSYYSLILEIALVPSSFSISSFNRTFFALIHSFGHSWVSFTHMDSLVLLFVLLIWAFTLVLCFI